eukprot:15198565-Alexandrium_andersonii.AAC.1
MSARGGARTTTPVAAGATRRPGRATPPPTPCPCAAPTALPGAGPRRRPPAARSQLTCRLRMTLPVVQGKPPPVQVQIEWGVRVSSTPPSPPLGRSSGRPA